ncbi:unnamed protein product [Camellia sinensis]
MQLDHKQGQPLATKCLLSLDRNFDSIKNETKKGRVWKQWFQSFSCSVCLGVLQDQKPTTDEQDKLTQLSLGNFARNTSQPLPRLPDHEETYNHEVLPSPPCKRAELSSLEGKSRTYKKFSFEEMEKLIEGVEKYGGKYCNWKTIKKLYFEDSNRSKDQLKEKWRHMKKSANKQTDPHLKKLYVRALKVQMSPPKSKSSKCKVEELPNSNLENQ